MIDKLPSDNKESWLRILKTPQEHSKLFCEAAWLLFLRISKKDAASSADLRILTFVSAGGVEHVR